MIITINRETPKNKRLWKFEFEVIDDEEVMLWLLEYSSKAALPNGGVDIYKWELNCEIERPSIPKDVEFELRQVLKTLVSRIKIY